MKEKKWLILALVLAAALPACALGAPFALKTLFWRLGGDPAVAVLRGEHWGLIVRMALLTAAPFVPVACFILEQAGVRRAKRRWESAQPPEFATREERRDFYRKELNGQRKAPGGTPWIAYAALCGAAVFLFGTEVLRAALPQEIGETGRDLELYRSGQAEVYQGPLLLVERQLRRGARALPDERFVYYDTAGGGSLRCAAALLSYTQLTQLSYTVTYLPGQYPNHCYWTDDGRIVRRASCNRIIHTR